jgi:hypothetical protein
VLDGIVHGCNTGAAPAVAGHGVGHGGRIELAGKGRRRARLPRYGPITAPWLGVRPAGRGPRARAHATARARRSAKQDQRDRHRRRSPDQPTTP